MYVVCVEVPHFWRLSFRRMGGGVRVVVGVRWRVVVVLLPWAWLLGPPPQD